MIRNVRKHHAIVDAFVALTLVGGATAAYSFYSASIATAAPEDATGAVGDTEPLQNVKLSAAVPSVKLGESALVVYAARNPNPGQPVRLNSVSPGSLSVDEAHRDCPAGSFTLTDFNSSGAQDIPAGETVAVGTEMIHYNNLSVSQNACIGANLTVAFSTA